MLIFSKTAFPKPGFRPHGFRHQVFLSAGIAACGNIVRARKAAGRATGDGASPAEDYTAY